MRLLCVCSLHVMVFWPAGNSWRAYKMCKGANSGGNPSVTHTNDLLWGDSRLMPVMGKLVTMTRKTDMREDSVLYRVSSSCFWFGYMSLVCVAFIYHSNHTRVRLEADRDPSFQRSQFACLVRARVQMAAFTYDQMNRTNRAIAPGFVLIEPNMTSVNAP